MSKSWPVLGTFVLGLLVLGACDRQEGAPPAVEDAEARMLARGELLSLACQACHSLDAGGPNLVGPNLHGVFGRPAGGLASFGGYSPALRNADFVWTADMLDRWLADPAGFLPGTAMTFTGYKGAEDRAALIQFLVQATGEAAAD